MSKIKKILMNTMMKELLVKDKDKDSKIFKKLKATRNPNYKKLLVSLTPFLKDANLYDEWQKKYPQYYDLYKILDRHQDRFKFKLAIYLIGHKFGIPITRFFSLGDDKKNIKIIKNFS